MYCVIYYVFDPTDLEWIEVKSSSRRVAIWKARKFVLDNYGSFCFVDIFN